MSADPLIQAPDNTQSFNRYSYVFNNPMSFTDPTGFVGDDGGAGCRANPSCSITYISGAGLDRLGASILGLEGKLSDYASLGEVNVSDGKGGTVTKHAFLNLTKASNAASTAESANATSSTTTLPEQAPSTPVAEAVSNAGDVSAEGAAQQGQNNRVDIAIGYTDTPVKAGNHALVIATDPVTGEQYATRAGPRLNDKGGCCLIHAEHGIYDASFRDAPDNVHTTQNVGALNISISEFVGRAAEFSKVTNANHVPYLGVTSNSNSYAFTFTRSLGFNPKPIVSAPGWQSGSPSSKLTYQ